MTSATDTTLNKGLSCTGYGLGCFDIEADEAGEPQGLLANASFDGDDTPARETAAEAIMRMVEEAGNE